MSCPFSSRQSKEIRMVSSFLLFFVSLALFFENSVQTGVPEEFYGCFDVWENSRVLCVQDYNQLTQQASLQSCLRNCVNLQDKCQAMDFSGADVCTLYFVEIKTNKYVQPTNKRSLDCKNGNKLTAKMGTTHYRPNHFCQPKTLPPASIVQKPVTDTAATCKDGEREHYLHIRDMKIVGHDHAKVSVSNSDECLVLCSRNRLNDGRTVNCLAAEYNHRTQECVLSKDNTQTNKALILKSHEHMEYYEKVCLKWQSDRQCPAPISVHPQFILAEADVKTVVADSFNDCVRQCLHSQALHGVKCKSGMFLYAVEQPDNCILNDKTRYDLPDNFGPLGEENFPVDYFQVNCLEDMTHDNNPNPSIYVSGNEWGEWTSCNSFGSEQRRFRNCPEPNLDECDRQVRKCSLKDGKNGTPKLMVLMSNRQRGNSCNPMQLCCKHDRHTNKGKCEGYKLNEHMRMLPCHLDNC